MAYLALVRHGQSTWNAQNFWTGWTDVSLTDQGKDQARKAGAALSDIKFDLAFVSDLTRAKQTLAEIKQVFGYTLPITEDSALKERDYGDLTGRDKEQVEKEYGQDQYQKWRRSWDYPIPHGESLADVYKRAVPYYQQHILPKLKLGKNVLISFHGNSMRALIKYLENIPDSEIPHLEIGLGEIYLYQIDQSGNIINKEIRASS